MYVVVSYDVETRTPAGKKRLRKVARACLDFGQRVQLSVFECNLGRQQWVVLRQRLLAAFDPASDSLRFYFLGEDPGSRIEHHGTKETSDTAGLLLA
jgi:CRISPR-associated protein Cas2